MRSRDGGEFRRPGTSERSRRIGSNRQKLQQRSAPAIAVDAVPQPEIQRFLPNQTSEAPHQAESTVSHPFPSPRRTPSDSWCCRPDTKARMRCLPCGSADQRRVCISIPGFRPSPVTTTQCSASPRHPTNQHEGSTPAEATQNGDRCTRSPFVLPCFVCA